MKPVRMLYVEDNAELREIFQEMLEGDQREVVACASAEEALVIMAQSYDRLGVTELRDDAQRVLAKNFPNSRFASEGLTTRQRQWWQFW